MDLPQRFRIASKQSGRRKFLSIIIATLALLTYLAAQPRSRSASRVPRSRPILQRLVISRRRLSLLRLLPAHQAIKDDVALEQRIRGFKHRRLAAMGRTAPDRLGRSSSGRGDGSSGSACGRVRGMAGTRDRRREVARLRDEVNRDLVQTVLRSVDAAGGL